MTDFLLQHLERDLKAAVSHFWAVRAAQAKKQRKGKRKKRDRGSRGAVTGGKQLDGFIKLVRDLLIGSGLNNATIFAYPRAKVPGWFRKDKDWDLLVVADGKLVAAIEFKSHVGSFGNNFNNRAEEALGNATDLWAAFREGAFAPSPRPWVGFLMLLEQCPQSTRRSKPGQSIPHFPIFREFEGTSYADRYALLLTKLVRERLYDAACLLLSPQPGQTEVTHSEPSDELCFRNFVTPLLGRAMAVAATQTPAPRIPPRVETASDRD